ncbi:hypothetical protein FRZ61_49160 [Hypericibacter adhaerens]|uniref:DUF2971 domain-containing protein n=1 Tax=Hypericibacter adhaerens TaxID=2602016 RepID=A0A5J6N7U4_9PROT|nr:hypothetical protein FRZ61_49160 [Hypericibacter adhaerens]
MPSPEIAISGDIEPHAHLLSVPSEDQLLYKMMTLENLIRSIEGRYLHFNRVDSYFDFQGADHHDGEQLPGDRQGNAAARFEKSPEFSAAHYYDQSRARTYASCFSTENSAFIWNNYATDGNKGKVCLVFDFGKLRATLNSTLSPNQAALIADGARCHQIFSINYGLVDYVDWNSHRANVPVLPNPICYTFIKAKEFSDEKELRIALSAFGLGRFELNNGNELQFPRSLQMAFSYHAAFANGTIKSIETGQDCDRDFLESELCRLRINPVPAPTTS